MLVLSRRPGETLVLETSDGTVTLSIQARRGRGVSIGIEAPKAVTVLRGELQSRDPQEREP